MDIAFLLGTKIIELTLIVLIGYGLVKSKLLKSEDSKTLSVIGLYVISPAVMIEAFQIDYTPEILTRFTAFTVYGGVSSGYSDYYWQSVKAPIKP